MKTAFGKLTMLAFVLALAILLLAPMRSGIEDSLVCTADAVSLAPGETVAVSYELRTETAQTVVYRSDNAYVAAVDQRGLITAVSPGRTKIHLLAQGGASDTVDVEVSGVPVKTFALNTHELEMDKGEVSGLSYQFNHGAAEQEVVWSSADPEIVRVDEAGRLVAVGAGETYVTASTVGGLTDTALVRVNLRGASVRIEPAEMTVGVGAAFKLSTHFQPEDATDRPVRWTSSDSQVLAVSDNGAIRAVSAGTAVVTVTTKDGLTASAVVSVDTASRGLAISEEEMAIERGDSRTLEVAFIGSDGQPMDVERYVQWKSSDPAVAGVENGVVTGVSSGIATITAVADGFENFCAVTVRTSVTEVQLNVEEQTLYKDQTDEPFLIRASVLPADADDRMLTFTSDNPLVATVSQNGLVTMTGGYGTAVITVEANNGVSATCTVNVVLSEEEKQN